MSSAVYACVLSHVRLFATPWTGVCQSPLSMEFSTGKSTGVGCHFLHWGSSPPRDPTHISCIGRQILYCWTIMEAQIASGKLLYNTGCLAWLSVVTERGEFGGDEVQQGGDIYIYFFFNL